MTKTYEQSKPELVTELTPTLAEKIFKSIMQKRYNEKVSKDVVLQNLKQLKAQMGKEKKSIKYHEQYDVVRRDTIDLCMKMIDNKIAKINGK